MKTISVLCGMCVAMAGTLSGQEAYERYFSGTTLRVDCYHGGTKGEERFSLDGLIEEGPWPGHRVNLVDTLNLGEYLLAVYDRSTNVLIYSRGFSSMFNEWQTTDAALSGTYRTFSESFRMPFPRRSVRMTISRRDKKMEFHELFSSTLDPTDPAQVRRQRKAARYSVVPIMENGAPSAKVDILILGDGYAVGDIEKFRSDARKYTDALFATHPFRERKKDFNVWRIDVTSDESGIDIPGKNVWKRHALGCRYDTFGSARYVLTEENKTLRDIAGSAPYDFLCILVNDTRYGGGGIYNLYATTYTNEPLSNAAWQTEYVFVHEFGHSFAGLGDEYYTSSTAYNDFYLPGVEPWEPNITSQTDPSNLKWGKFLTPGIEIPTSWEKAAYDSIAAIWRKLDRLAPDYYPKAEPLLRAEAEVLKNSRNGGKVGVFEGSGYASRGLYRPAVDCRMFSLSTVDFDPVCSAAILRVIDFYASPMTK